MEEKFLKSRRTSLSHISIFQCYNQQFNRNRSAHCEMSSSASMPISILIIYYILVQKRKLNAKAKACRNERNVNNHYEESKPSED